MPVDTLDPARLEQHVAQVKAAWHKHARSLTWEQKVAAIERMRERDALLKAARDAGVDLGQPGRLAPLRAGECRRRLVP